MRKHDPMMPSIRSPNHRTVRLLLSAILWLISGGDGVLSDESGAAIPYGADPDCGQVTARLEPRQPEWENFDSSSGEQAVPAEYCSAESPAAFSCEPPSRQWYAGGEIIMAKPRLEDGAEEDEQRHVMDFLHLHATPRVWLGLVDEQGLGLRARFWRFENVSSVDRVLHVPLQGDYSCMGIDAHTLDAEITQQFCICQWDATIASGVRYASLEQRIMAADADDFRGKRFRAIGPILSLDLHRSLGRFGFAWIANARGSLSVGEAQWSAPGRAQNTDDIGSILDMQIGLQWSRCFPRLGKVAVRGTYDQQNWFGTATSFGTESSAANGMLGIQPDDHDLAFMGFSVGVELTR